MFSVSKITDEQLDKAIKITVVLIIGSIISFSGYYLYSRYIGVTPTVVEKAILETEKSVRANRNDLFLRVRLAGLYFEKKRYGDAIEQYKVALGLNKKYGPALVGMGMAYVQKGDDAKALDYFNQEITVASKGDMAHIDTTLEKAYFYSGVIYADRKDYKKALDFFTKAVKIRSDASDTHFYLGYAYFNLKQADKAISSFKRALAFEPKYPEAHYYLGQAYESKGMKKEAKEEYRQAIKASPDYTEAKNALSKLE